MLSFLASLSLHSATLEPEAQSLLIMSTASLRSFFISFISSSARSAPSQASPLSPSSSIALLNATAAPT